MLRKMQNMRPEGDEGEGVEKNRKRSENKRAPRIARGKGRSKKRLTSASKGGGGGGGPPGLQRGTRESRAENHTIPVL